MKKVFCIGALGYGLIEILWRGRTHWSMLLTGGACLCGMVKICQKRLRESIGRLSLRCASLITAMEFAVGMLVNRRKNVWDYSERPGNIAGQICPLYSFLWFLLSLPIVCFLKNHLKKKIG